MQFVLEYNGDSDVRRCLEFLYSTKAGSVPMDRNFGIDTEPILGQPLDVAKNQLALEIITKTEIYEPRVAVESIEFEVDPTEGRITPIIHITEGGEEDE